MTYSGEYYRKSKEAGNYATKSDVTWNRKINEHTCCGSKARWRHKVKCHVLQEINSDDLSDLT